MFRKFTRDVMVIVVGIALVYVVGIVVFQMTYALGDYADASKLNLLGDSIGGLTAPLALIFLIAAVIIQRQELALTKAELAKTAEAMAGQVIEQRQHREFVGQQTDLMRKEAEAAAETTRKTYKLSLFDRRYAVNVLLKETRKRLNKKPIAWDEMFDEIEEIRRQAEFLFPENVSAFLQDVQSAVLEAETHDIRRRELLPNTHDPFANMPPEEEEKYKHHAQRIEDLINVLKMLLGNERLYEVFAASMKVTD